MIVGAFLAEAAAAVDNKLNVSGGVLYRYWVDTDRAARFLLVVLTQTETDDPHQRIEVEIRPPTDDEPLLMGFELPDAATTAEVGFAIFNVEVSLPADGRWVIVVTGGAGAISLPLLISG
ncbi:hypothetical protein [Mycobacterium ulcerans]|uniref:Uncharacterized protein n=1 Tax=Mycobacterium ulcerans subsp. shinshuense TaxID=1124626 RepID=A0A1B4Y9J4_MYCUL|nr:hypothetical protein [Mycobacterium ulcerans]BAV43737.1 hypothetical protein SHTP_4881 [Mycobacterium ulcerans subsp. shinshuense]